MRIAITGGRGRMGTAVATLALAEGHEVVSIDNRPPGPDDLAHPDLASAIVDVTSYDALAAAMTGSDAVVHLAAFTGPGGRPASLVHNTNVTASYNALVAAMELGIDHVCQASSVNATGAVFSRAPKYDYFPLDEHHLTYNEDPYSLSKWICELQADSVARRAEHMTISSLRLHRLVPNRETVVEHLAGKSAQTSRDLWGYTTAEAVARAVLASLAATWHGHEVFYVVAPRTAADTPSAELARQYYPEVPLRHELEGFEGFYDCSKARELLGWVHDLPA